ncbi:MAG: hypothetical protein HKO53_13660 [Gemmatimonadetes bacterium]|nr:hypothetical protein [Gemmatimonadota bacterium]
MSVENAGAPGSRLEDRALGVAPLQLPTWLVALAATVLFAAWRWPVLHQVPVWDGAMGMTPAAITLESLGFDVFALLAMPNYAAGGPNAHALSAFTWLVAGAIRLFGSYEAALPFLHVLSFGLVGVLAAGVYRLVVGTTGRWTLAVAAAAAALLYPPLVVQGSDVYLELPLAAAATWAMALALEGRWKTAVAALTAGALIKPTAIIVVPALAAAHLLRSRDVRPLLALAVPTAVSVFPVFADRAVKASTAAAPSTVSRVTAETLGYLEAMPVLLAVILAAALLFVAGMRTKRLDPNGRSVLVATLVLVLSYLAFFCLNPLLTKGFAGIPRYTILFAPVLCASVVLGAHALWERRGGWAASGSLAAVFALNLYGGLEPENPGNIYPLAERSLAYEQLLGVQQQAMARFEELAARMPSVYDHYTHYRVTYPGVGWTGQAPADGTAAWLSPGRPWANLENRPDRFVMLLDAPWLGGRELLTMWERALESPDWDVSEERFEDGPFSNHVLVLSRRDGGQTRAPTGAQPGASRGRTAAAQGPASAQRP